MERVRANDVEIACEITGAGPPIVLCHGGEADHRNFYNFAPLLARSFTVIAYDQRDTGETVNGETGYDAADLGKDVGALIGALGYDRAHVFGTSWGGIIAQEAAVACPGRVDRLVLSATWPGGQWAVTDEFYRTVRAEKTEAEVHAYWGMFFSPAFAQAHPDEVVRRMRRCIVNRSPEQRARRSGSNRLHDEAPQRLATIRSPTLVLAGAEDRIVSPAFSHRLAELIPNASIVLLKGVGHATTLENPEEVAEVVERHLRPNRAPALASGDG